MNLMTLPIWAQSLIGTLFFALLGLIIHWFEMRRPARESKGHSIKDDTIAFLVVFLIFGTLNRYLQEEMKIDNQFLEGIPLVLKFVIYILTADFLAYWIHRFSHHSMFWRLHKWHHSSSHLYWLSGTRASMIQILAFGFPFFVMNVLEPRFLLPTGTIFVYCQLFNHFNRDVELGWVGKILVTPQIHRIHHAKDLRLANSNFGTLWTVWDRMFGSYIDPRTISDSNFELGIKEKNPSSVRMGLGV